LNPQFGHRHTACILNISTPQRSQTTASDFGCEDPVRDVAGDRGVSGRDSVSDMGKILLRVTTGNDG
jgi:hypothetical protein